MTTPAARSPRAWLAALLSVLAPPAGFVYCRRWRAAVLATVAVLVGGVVAVLLIVRLPGAPLNVLFGLVVLLGVALGIPLLAFRTARHSLPSRSSSLRMVAVVLAVIIVWHVISDRMILVIRADLEAYQTPSDAMAPTLLAGDYFFVRKHDFAPTVGYGALVAYDRNGVRSVKRLVGMSGDTLAMRGGRLLRNGLPVDEPYAVQNGPVPAPTVDNGGAGPSSSTWGPTIVPPGHLFVLGDNRENSHDSRYWGFLPVEGVFGTATRVYFSRDNISGQIRWRRIGHDL